MEDIKTTDSANSVSSENSDVTIVKESEKAESTATSTSVSTLNAENVIDVEKELKLIKDEKEKEKPNYDDIFITENDTFDCSISYYYENGIIFVDNIDDGFNKNANNIKKILVTFKYPSQGDIVTITNSLTRNKKDSEKEGLDIFEINALELSRMFCLIRKWSIDKKINNESLLSLSPKIVKAMTYGIREKIGYIGIF